jgi:hypothetical protein
MWIYRAVMGLDEDVKELTGLIVQSVMCERRSRRSWRSQSREIKRKQAS